MLLRFISLAASDIDSYSFINSPFIVYLHILLLELLITSIE
nr:MAG TPA: hypothetical protein [Caudoviricetes sp.]